ncbi:VTT domain-containing protein [Paucibacter sp. B2R-40]|uniref:TVP38/TMEM64 family protein n=1 Tax=Paucibacter sp. B2R-40 TaxID=2893554 RepID=UPI0021E456FC|nr:VTT domain-containing protein [Paucibacter sp. B2R-40]MCV2352953.1 VTT domain-containing protein [Paucibacter sp. B2R-40]
MYKQLINAHSSGQVPNGTTIGSQAALMRAPIVRIFALAVILLLLWSLVRLTGLQVFFTQARLQEVLLGHPVLAVFGFSLLFMGGNLVQVPGLLFLAAAELTLGPLRGAALTYLAACLACISTFAVSRTIGGDALRCWDSGSLGRSLFAQLDRRPTLTVFGLRLLFQTVPALNYSLALSGIRFRHYFWGTLLGLPLPILLYSIFIEQVAGWLHLAAP